MMVYQEPIDPSKHIPDPLIAQPDSGHVTPEQVIALIASVERLHRDVNRRAISFLVALILIVVLGAATAILGYRSERFLSCQVEQNTDFRHAQRALFKIINDPNATPEQRHQATIDYDARLAIFDQYSASGVC